MTTTHDRLASGNDARVCVTCDQPIYASGPISFRHLDGQADHPAQPKLATPADPFAGIDDAEPVFASDRDVDTADEPAEGSPAWHDLHHNGRAYTRDWTLITGHDSCDWDVCVEWREQHDGPTFPPADPEPSMSLQQFQQRVARGDWNGGH